MGGRRAPGGSAATPSASGCNWLVPAGGGRRLLPRLPAEPHDPRPRRAARNLERWRAIEAAKRRLVYALMRFGLPLRSQHEDEARGLAFDFLADTAPDEPVMTGHDDGLITINIAEADSAERERRRVELGEPYRTLLGHLRHEVGHYYWDVLVRDGGKVEAARAVFGDETRGLSARRCSATIATARRRTGRRTTSAPMRPCTRGRISPRPGRTTCTWSTRSTPPASFGLAVDPPVRATRATAAEIDFDPYRARDFDRLVERLDAADRRGQQPEPQHGPARPLSVRAEPAGDREAAASSTS